MTPPAPCCHIHNIWGTHELFLKLVTVRTCSFVYTCPMWQYPWIILVISTSLSWLHILTVHDLHARLHLCFTWPGLVTFFLESWHKFRSPIHYWIFHDRRSSAIKRIPCSAENSRTICTPYPQTTAPTASVYMHGWISGNISLDDCVWVTFQQHQ